MDSSEQSDKNPQPPKAEPKDSIEIGSWPVPGIILRRILKGHIGTINRIAWSPDGRFMASASRDETIRIWDVEGRKCLAVLVGHTDDVSSVAWSPDANMIVSVAQDGSVKLWDANTGSYIRDLQKHNFSNRAIAWSPDGKKLAGGSGGGDVTSWVVATGELQVCKPYAGWTAGPVWSPNSNEFVSGSSNGNIMIWDIQTNTLLREFQPYPKYCQDVAISPDGTIIASCHTEVIVLSEYISGKSIVVLEGHTAQTSCVSFSPDGRFLASKSSDTTCIIWDVTDAKEIASFKESDSGSYDLVVFNPTSFSIATVVKSENSIRIWELTFDEMVGQSFTESVRYTTAKLVLVGDSGVGKTGLGWRLAHGDFKEHASTHGQQFWVIDELRNKRKDGTECEAVLWDLAGQAIYGMVHAIFLDDVDLSLVLFDPGNRQDPLKGAQFWLEQLAGKNQLPPTVLVGARVDRGSPVLSKQELDQFCQRYGISGGYISTSAFTGEGLDKLLEILKSQIPWDRMTATVTTVTFKRIKEFVLALKEKPDRKGVLVRPAELRRQLEDVDPDWQFTDAEMMTAVKHLETHGYVAVLRSSSGEEVILLVPELLVNLASSIVLQADRHPRELGALSETALLQGSFQFPELENLEQVERQVLLDAAVVRFLGHNICFRETLGAEALLIFPRLIKQKRPLIDEVEVVEEMSYIVRGRVENVYAALVVLLGYTPTFTRINQWQNQAQYEMKGEICGFRLIEEREGEIEMVLYYSKTMPDYGHNKFQGLFEEFLYQRDVDVTRFPPVICRNGHRQERATVVKRLLEGKTFLFCEECGEKIDLPEMEKPLALGTKDARWILREEAAARLRSAYEAQLVRVKSYRLDRAAPRCFISHTPEQSSWVSQLADDLRAAGVFVLEDSAQIQEKDFIVIVGTPAYKKMWDYSNESIEVAPLIRARLQQDAGQWPTIVPLLREGDSGTANLRELLDRRAGDFRDESHYPVSLFDLVLTLYAISFRHPAFEPLRKSLQKQWSDKLGDSAREIAPGGEIFISYAWGGESEALADKLDQSFQDRGVTIIRDKRDLGYKGSIREFMQSLGRGKCVILVISDKYLKSPNCLFELLQVAEHGDFAQRVFPVVLKDARIYDPLDRLGYVKYWEERREELDSAIKEVSAANLQGIREDIDLYTEIRALLARLSEVLKVMNTLTPEMHSGSDFSELFEAVMAKLEE